MKDRSTKHLDYRGVSIEDPYSTRRLTIETFGVPRLYAFFPKHSRLGKIVFALEIKKQPNRSERVKLEAAGRR